MGENEPLAKYIQRRLRGRNIGDKAVANILNLSVKTVPKIYQQTEIPCDRIAKLSILLNENIYLKLLRQRRTAKIYTKSGS